MPNTPPNFMAEGTIRPSRFVKIGTVEDKALEADANDIVIGIAMESTNQPPLEDLVTTQIAANAGQHFRMYGDGDVCFIEVGETVAPGDRLKSDAEGVGMKILTTGTVIQHFGARVLESGVIGELVRVQVLIGSERPALS